jgi:predicted aspartyl protease
MRLPVFTVAMAILVTGLALLLVFGRSSSIAGLAPGDFASVVYLSIFGLLVASGLAYGRHRVNARLWHVAAWLAIFAALIAGYRWFHPPVQPVPSSQSESI